MSVIFEKRAVTKLQAVIVIAIIAVAAIAGGYYYYMSTQKRTTVVVYGWEAGVELAEKINEDFKKKTGFEIQWVPLAPGTAIARVIAEKDNPKADIITYSEVEHLKPIKEGVIDKIPKDKIPNIQNLLRNDYPFITDYWIPNLYCFFGILCVNPIAWNATGLAWPPTPLSYDIFLLPELKGKIALTDITTGHTYGLLGLLHQVYGPEKMWSYLRMLKPQLKQVYGTWGLLKTAWFKGETPVILAWEGQPLQARQKEGVPAQGFVMTQYGNNATMIRINVMSLVKNGPNREGALALINYWLSPEVQKIQYDIGQGLPVVKGVSVSEDLIKYTFNGISFVDMSTKYSFILDVEWWSEVADEYLATYNKIIVKGE